MSSLIQLCVLADAAVVEFLRMLLSIFCESPAHVLVHKSEQEHLKTSWVPPSRARTAGKQVREGEKLVSRSTFESVSKGWTFLGHFWGGVTDRLEAQITGRKHWDLYYDYPLHQI